MRLIRTIITAMAMLLSADLSAQQATIPMLMSCIDSSAMAKSAASADIDAARQCAERFAPDLAKCLMAPKMQPMLQILRRGNADSASAWIMEQDGLAAADRAAILARLSILSLQIPNALSYYDKAMQRGDSASLPRLLEYSECCLCSGVSPKALILAQKALAIAPDHCSQYASRMQMARALIALENPDEAMLQVAAAEALGIKPAKAPACNSPCLIRAQAYMLKGEPQMAMMHLASALKACPKSKAAIRQRIGILRQMSSLYAIGGQYALAEQCLSEAIGCAHKSGSQTQRHLTCASIYLQWGSMLKATGKLDIAREKLQQSLQSISQAVMMSRSYIAGLAEIEAALAAIEIEVKDYRRAEALCEEAYLIYSRQGAQAGPDSRAQKAALLRTYGDLYAAMGQYIEASRKYSEALAEYQAIRRAGRQAPALDMAMALNNMGSMYEGMGNYADAVANYKIAARLLAQAQKSEPGFAAHYARTLSNIGNIYRKSSQPDSSLKYMEEALCIFRSKTMLNDSEKAEYAKICNNLGLQYRSINKLEIAEPFFEAAYNTAKQLQAQSPAYKPLWADVLNNYGLYSIDSGDDDLGLYYLTQALEIRQETTQNNEASPALADSYDNIGDLHMRKGELEPAEQSYEQARRIREQLVTYYPMIQYPDYACTMQKLAKAYCADKSLFQALVVISNLAETLCSIDTWEDENLLVERANAYHNKALILAELGNSKDARDLMLMAAQTYSDAGNEYDIRHKEAAAAAFCMAGNYSCDINDYEQAESLFKSALSISKRLYTAGQMPASSIVGALNSLGRVYYSMQNMEEAKKCYEQGRSIIDQDPASDTDIESILASAIVKLNIVEYYIYEKNSGIDDDEYSNCVKYLEETIATLKPFAENSSVEHYYSQARLLLNNILN